MWGAVIITFLFGLSAAFELNNADYTRTKNETVYSEARTINPREEFDGFHVGELKSVLEQMEDWAFSAADFVKGRFGTQNLPEAVEYGRRFKRRKAELKFIMKSLVILKVVLGLILPLGIISSKLLSWKAVTLSLMAFMLAKILFVKNLIGGKNPVPVAPTNFVPPLFIHGGPNDFYWKRQGYAQNYPWNST